MTRIDSVKPTYQNNLNWAIANKNRGRNATASAIGSTIAGCAKVFTEAGSRLNKGLNITQKIFDGIRNHEQYSLYKRKDDDLGFDEKHKPLAQDFGILACAYETKINPIALPVSAFLNERFSESYSAISNWFNSLWWRVRPACENLNLKELKKIAVNCEKLFDDNIKIKANGQSWFSTNLSPILGWIGSFFMGVFVPLKAWNKFNSHENKWVDACADAGFSSQHLLYFFRFTSEELLEAQNTNNKNRWFLFGLGTGANVMNITLPFVDVIPVNDKTKILWKELSQGLARTFFSVRRNIKGKEWLVENRERVVHRIALAKNHEELKLKDLYQT